MVQGSINWKQKKQQEKDEGRPVKGDMLVLAGRRFPMQCLNGSRETSIAIRLPRQALQHLDSVKVKQYKVIVLAFDVQPEASIKLAAYIRSIGCGEKIIVCSDYPEYVNQVRGSFLACCPEGLEAAIALVTGPCPPQLRTMSAEDYYDQYDV